MRSYGVTGLRVPAVGLIHRRAFLAASTAAGALAVSRGLGPVGRALAGLEAGEPAWKALRGLEEEARTLGLSSARALAAAPPGPDDGFERLLPRLLALIDSLETPAARTLSESAALGERAEALLIRIHRAERGLPPERPPVESALWARSVRPRFEDIRDDYVRLFETCKLRDKWRSQVAWYISRLTRSASRARYEEVAEKTGVPWYFVGVIHAMEASFNFRAHLHNGDSLKRRTRHVPRGRPKKWNPPTDWVSSAVDALTYEGFVGQSDWSLARMLYRLEAYNGFRSRANGINTPYLWSFSNHYTKGKFVADNVWDPNAVSKQCGAAVMLRVLVDRGEITIPGASESAGGGSGGGSGDAEREKLRAELAKREKAVAEREAVAARKEAGLAERETRLGGRKSALEARRAKLEARRAALRDKEPMLARRENALGQRQKAIAERERAVEMREAAIARREKALEAGGKPKPPGAPAEEGWTDTIVKWWNGLWK